MNYAKIKFRGQTPDGRWAYGDLLHVGSGCIIVTNKELGEPLPESDIALSYNREEIEVVIPDTVGQYVGSYDCEKREVYEGDIIKSYICFLNEDDEMSEFWRVGIVRFVSGKYQLTNCVNYDDENAEIKSELQPSPKMQYSFPAYRSKIIGNIYDNPEEFYNPRNT